jgi:hypothetical protein
VTAEIGTDTIGAAHRAAMNASKRAGRKRPADDGMGLRDPGRNTIKGKRQRGEEQRRTDEKLLHGVPPPSLPLIVLFIDVNWPPDAFSLILIKVPKKLQQTGPRVGTTHKILQWLIDFAVSWWDQGPPKIRKIPRFFKSVGKCPPFCLHAAQQVATDFCGQEASWRLLAVSIMRRAVSIVLSGIAVHPCRLRKLGNGGEGGCVCKRFSSYVARSNFENRTG